MFDEYCDRWVTREERRRERETIKEGTRSDDEESSLTESSGHVPLFSVHAFDLSKAKIVVNILCTMFYEYCDRWVVVIEE